MVIAGALGSRAISLEQPGAQSGPGPGISGTGVPRSDTSARSLLLCRTPLQGEISVRLIQERLLACFDLVYLTIHDSKLDQAYFRKLAEHSVRALYLRERGGRFRILASLASARRIRQFSRGQEYRSVYLASVDSFAFASVLRNERAEVFTFDDGAANIMRPSIFQQPPTFREWLYWSAAGVPSSEQILSRSRKHFSIYAVADNVVPAHKIRFLRIFDDVSPATSDGELAFFIGQPFHEYLDPAGIQKMRDFVRAQHFDYYVQHPRETERLVDTIPLLDTSSELGERAILKVASGRRPTIYACFSSLLLNIDSALARKVYLSASQDASEDTRIKLALATGCEVLRL